MRFGIERTRHCKTVLVAVILLLAAQVARAQSGTPVTLANSDFELGTTANWVPRGVPDASTVYSIVGGGALGSAHCGKMTVTSSSSTMAQQAVYYARTDFPNTVGWYRLSFWMKTQLTPGRAGAYLIIGGTPYLVPGQAGNPLIQGTSDWTLYSLIYPVTTSAAVVLQLQATNSVLGTVWVDNLALEKLPNPDALSNNGFETGSLSPGWSYRSFSPADAAAYSVQTGTGNPEGTHWGQIDINSATSANLQAAAYFSRFDLPHAPGTYYRLTYWMKTTLPQGWAGAYLSARNSANQVIQSWPAGQSGMPIAGGTTGWAQYTFVYQVPTDATAMVMTLQADQAGGSAGSSTICFDKIVVQAISTIEGAAAILQQTPPDIGLICGPAIEQPCAIVHPLAGHLYNDPGNGHPMLALNSCTSPHGSAVLLDYNTPASPVTTALSMPVGTGGWDLTTVLTNQLLFESIGSPLSLVRVSKTTKSIVSTSTPSTSPSNSYAWQFVKGSDGYVYYGSYPTCHAYKSDGTGASVTDLGSMDVDYSGTPNSPSNKYVRYIGMSGSSDPDADGWLLSSILGSTGSSTAGVVAWKDGEPGYPKMVQDTKGSAPRFCTVRNNTTQEAIVYAWGFVGNSKLQQFDPYQMKFIDATLPPANLPPAPSGNWTQMLQSSKAGDLVVANGANWYRVQGSTITPLFNNNLLKGAGALVGLDSAGNVVGYRGQQYFVAPPNPSTLSGYLHPIFPPSGSPPPALAPFFLRADPAGGVTGAAPFGQTLFRYNPGPPVSLVNTDQVLSSDGEVYDGRWHNGKFYFVAYGGGQIGVWDPAQPWDQYNGVNPKLLASTGYTRPQGGMVQNPTTKKFYTGWSGPYYTLTGGLSEYDPATDTWRKWDSPIFNAASGAVSLGTVASDNTYVYGLTSNDFNGNSTPAAQLLTFWMFNPAGSGTVLAKVPLDVTSGAACCWIPGTNKVWVALPTGLRLFNTSTKTLGPLMPWPAQVGRASIGKFDSYGNSAWFAVGSTVVQLCDGSLPYVKVLFKASGGITGVAANGVDNKLYVSSGVDLYSTALN